MGKFESFAPLVGRILLAQIFIASGLNKISGWEQTAGYMASKDMPMVPLFLFAAIVLEVGGGISILLGFKAKIGAAALAIFLIPVSLVFHNFWALEGMNQQIQMIMFMKNLAIMGGLILLAAFGAGSYSIDSRTSLSSKTK